MLLSNIELYTAGLASRIGKSFFAKQLLNEYGFECVGLETVPMTATDATPQLIRLKDKGAELITAIAVGGEGAVFVKSIVSLGMDKTHIFTGCPYVMMGDVARVTGLDAMKGIYTATVTSNSIDELDERGIKEMRFVTEGIAGADIITGNNIMGALRVFEGSLFNMDILADRVGGLAKIIELYKTKPSEYVVKEIEAAFFEYLNHKYSMLDLGPFLFLPGRVSNQHMQLIQWREGKYGIATYAVKRQNGTNWEWVPPNIVHLPCYSAPRGTPVPLEGSIDYGPPFGVWDMERFFKEYTDESWVCEHSDELVA